MKRISKAEWTAKHDDFKRESNGIRYVLEIDARGATVSVPVAVADSESEAKEAYRTFAAHQRQRYMSNELSHDDYYLWLADWVGLGNSLIPFPADKIALALAKGDKHLNTLPLMGWDRMDGTVRVYVRRKGLAWSLSDTVCCLKAMARRLATS